jgi:hypothetical protein
MAALVTAIPKHGEETKRCLGADGRDAAFGRPGHDV